MIALTSVIPDFDPERAVVVGIEDRKQTYPVNTLIGRHGPGIYGGRERFHDNTNLSRLTVNPGLIVRLRLPASVVGRIAVDMDRTRRAPACPEWVPGLSRQRGCCANSTPHPMWRLATTWSTRASAPKNLPWPRPIRIVRAK